MSISVLLDQLHCCRQHWLANDYHNSDASEEAKTYHRFLNFVKHTDQCFSRSQTIGHVTASALVVNQSFDQVLLLHHRKLQKWLQLGGHADGETDPRITALKEAKEESGLAKISYLTEQASPFDLDIHAIPPRAKEPGHFHYDVRYLLVADHRDDLNPNHESNDLRWFSLTAARNITQERSMHRQFDKLDAIRRQRAKTN